MSDNTKSVLAHIGPLALVLVAIAYFATRPPVLQPKDAKAASNLMIDRYKLYGINLIEAPFIISSDTHMDGRVIFKDDDGKLATLTCSGDINTHGQIVVKCDPKSLRK